MNISILKVLLINPEYPNVYTHGPQANLIYPPLGLEYLASYIEDIAEVHIVDNRLELRNSQNIEKTIKSFNPDFVGISCNYSSQVDIVLKIAKTVKNLDTKTIVGGWHPTLVPQEMLESQYIDIVIRGEGELTLRELIKNNNPAGIKGLSYKENGKLIHNPDRELLNLRHILTPNRRKRSKKAKRTYNFLGFSIDLIETSRGCPYQCNFCCIHQFFRHTYRQRSIQDIITELQSAEIKNRASFVFIVDDNFMVNHKFVEELCNAIIQHGIKKYFIAQVRIDMIVKYPKVFKKMAEAGFILLFLGLESFSDRTLKNLNKQIRFNEIKAAIKILKHLGFIIQGSLIIGADLNDTPKDLESTIEIGKSLNIDLPVFSLLTPFPGTELMERALKEDLLLTTNWRDFNWSYPVLKYPHLTSDDLKYYLAKAYREMMFSKNPLQGIKRALQLRGYKFNISRIINVSMVRGIPRLLKYLSKFLSSRLEER